MSRFLGRELDPRTMTYRFRDGSGVPLPSEMRIETEHLAEEMRTEQGSFFIVHAFIEQWKARLGKLNG